MKKDKKKKEKITYIDDGRTIADMSNVGRGASRGKSPNRDAPSTHRPFIGKGTLSDQWNTYKSAVKMMFVPMLVAIGFICVVFLLAWLFLKMM